MSIYDEPEMIMEEISIELQCFILDMVLAGLKNLNTEQRFFRQSQKKKKFEDGDCDRRL